MRIKTQRRKRHILAPTRARRTRRVSQTTSTPPNPRPRLPSTPPNPTIAKRAESRKPPSNLAESTLARLHRHRINLRRARRIKPMRLVMRMPVKEPPLEDQDRDHADGDRRIRNVENRTEKFKILAAHKRHPGGIVGSDQREIQHIDNLPVKERSISMRWKQLRYMIVSASFEY